MIEREKLFHPIDLGRLKGDPIHLRKNTDKMGMAEVRWVWQTAKQKPPLPEALVVGWALPTSGRRPVARDAVRTSPHPTALRHYGTTAPAQLEAWVERMLDAATLAAVFAEG